MMFGSLRPYYFKRNAALMGIDFTVAGNGGSYDFALNNVPNANEFIALFDHYYISKVVMRFFPQVNQMNTGTNSGLVTVPLLYTAIDYDSTAVPASGTVIQQYATCKAVSATRPFTRVIVPRIANSVYRAAGGAFSVAAPRTWLDVAYTDVPHYGLVFFANPAIANGQFSYRVEATYYFACRATR